MGYRLGVVFTCLLTAWGVGAQESPRPSTNVFIETIDVNIVNITATVFAKDGNPVQGLSRDDFEIYEDGELMEISNFYAVQGGKVFEELLSEGPVERGQEVPPPVSLRPEDTLNHVALIVDNDSIQRHNRARVFQSLRDFLARQMGPFDRYMVAVNQGGDLRILKEFTGSTGDVVIALDQLERSPSEGEKLDAEHRNLVKDIAKANIAKETGSSITTIGIDTSSADYGYKILRGRVDSLAQREYGRVRKSLREIDRTVSAMSGLPGRNSIVLVTEGLPLRPGSTLFQALYNKFLTFEEELSLLSPESEVDQYDLSEDFEELLARAQAAGVTVSAIDCAGDRAGFQNTAEYGMPDSDSLIVASYVDAWSPTLDFERHRNLTAGSEMLAEGTGGSVLSRSRNYDDFFNRFRAQLDNYYSLGYAPKHGRDSKFHRIEVKVKGGGKYTVKHHENYVNKTNDEILADRALSQLVLANGDNAMGIQLALGQPEPKDKDRYVVPIQIGVPVDQLTLIPQADRHIGNVYMVVVVGETGGFSSPPHSVPLAINMSEEERSQSPPPLAAASMRLLVHESTEMIAIGVRDEIAGTVATARVPINVGLK